MIIKKRNNFEDKLIKQLELIDNVKDLCVISGGFAWHFICPENHEEHESLHDHKDIDLIVTPENAPELITRLKCLGYEKVWSKYDQNTFKRYVKWETIPNGDTVKILIDLFIECVPYITHRGYMIIDPKYLVSLYGKSLSSIHAWSMNQARKLISKGIDPIGRQELLENPNI